MIIASLQVAFLLMTALRLMAFKRNGARYRPLIATVAAAWAGGCLSLALSIVLKWPDSVGLADVCYAGIYGLMCAAAFWSGGNVAQLMRWLRIVPR